jgi:hypothetical protein
MRAEPPVGVFDEPAASLEVFPYRFSTLRFADPALVWTGTWRWEATTSRSCAAGSTPGCTIPRRGRTPDADFNDPTYRTQEESR